MSGIAQYEMDRANEIINSDDYEGYKIKDRATASGIFEAIAAYQAEIDEVHKEAEIRRAMLADWEMKETESNQQSIDFFEQKLREFWIRESGGDPKKKIKTSGGTLSTRKRPDMWDYDKTIDIVNELKQLGLDNLVNTKVTETPMKSEIKKVLRIASDGRVVTPDGEYVEGIQVIGQGYDIVVKGVK